MPNRKFSNRVRAVVVSGAMLSGLIGTAFVAPAANADVYSSYNLKIAAPGTQPVAPPNFSKGFSVHRSNVAGSETAEYALEGVGNLYNNAGIFGCSQNSDKRTCSGVGGAGPFNASAAYTANSDIYDNFDHDVVQQRRRRSVRPQVCSTCARHPPRRIPTSSASLTAGNGGVYPYWPYYTYPTPVSPQRGAPRHPDRPGAGLGVNRRPSEPRHIRHRLFGPRPAGCRLRDAVIGLSFSPHGTTAWCTAAGRHHSARCCPTRARLHQHRWRRFGDGHCVEGVLRHLRPPLQISTWDQLYALEGLSGGPDHPINHWSFGGEEQSSGTRSDVVHVRRLWHVERQRHHRPHHY